MLYIKIISEIALFFFLAGMVMIYKKRVVEKDEDMLHIYGNKTMKIIIRVFLPIYTILSLYILFFQFPLFVFVVLVTIFTEKRILMPMVEKCFVIPLSKIIVRHKEEDG